MNIKREWKYIKHQNGVAKFRDDKSREMLFIPFESREYDTHVYAAILRSFEKHKNAIEVLRTNARGATNGKLH